MSVISIQGAIVRFCVLISETNHIKGKFFDSLVIGTVHVTLRFYEV